MCVRRYSVGLAYHVGVFELFSIRREEDIEGGAVLMRYSTFSVYGHAPTPTHTQRSSVIADDAIGEKRTS